MLSKVLNIILAPFALLFLLAFFDIELDIHEKRLIFLTPHVSSENKVVCIENNFYEYETDKKVIFALTSGNLLFVFVDPSKKSSSPKTHFCISKGVDDLSVINAFKEIDISDMLKYQYIINSLYHSSP